MTTPIAIVIPAGGSGSRFDKKTKKQFLIHKEKSLLWWTLQCFFSLKENLQSIVVAIPPNLTEKESALLPQHNKISYCIGGSSRQESVLRGLEELKNENFTGICLVHDAARPLLAESDLKKLIQKIEETQDGALLAVKVADTIKKSYSNDTVEKTVDRSDLWQAQTPQGALFETLYQASLKAYQNKFSVTDDASILEIAGIKVHLVEGNRHNIKITTPEDWLSFTQHKT